MFSGLSQLVGDVGLGFRRDGLPKIKKAYALPLLEQAMLHLARSISTTPADATNDEDILEWLALVHKKGGCPLAAAIPSGIW